MEIADVLKKYGLRHTYPRTELVKLIMKFPMRHFCVEDILQHLKRTRPAISRASAYRTVGLFVKKGFLRGVDLGCDFQMYEIAQANEHHDHLYCVSCGRVIEFKAPAIEKLQTRAARRKSFFPLSHTLRISGICARCKSKKRK
jgi:Fur family ferric uptake transcriptional regulator